MSAPRFWIVYDHPPDFPDVFLARLFLNGKPTETCLRDTDVWRLRVVLAHNYSTLNRWPRSENDEPYIMELWM